MIPATILKTPFSLKTVILKGGFKPVAVVDDFPEYATDVRVLSEQQKRIIQKLAISVLSSLHSGNPIRAVISIGHADTALRLAGDARAEKESEVSWNRARSGARAFRDQLIHFASHEAASHMVAIKALGLGAAKKVIENARTEQDMRKNRRIEYYVVEEAVGAPNCGCHV